MGFGGGVGEGEGDDPTPPPFGGDGIKGAGDGVPPAFIVPFTTGGII
jgi:hypothetical protein